MHRVSRRTFLKSSACAALTAPLWSLVLRGSGSADTGNALAMVTGDRGPATRKAVELLGGMERFVPRGSRVVLKPNMSFPHPPQRATNTHPEVVAAVARLCREAGAGEVLVLDYPFNRPGPCLENSGIRDACSGIGKVYTLAVTEEKFFKDIAVVRGKALRRTKVMKDVLDSDVLINMPTAKSHTTTGVSLGMKGLMGLVWDRGYFHAKVDIDQAIADLSTAVAVNLVVLDASRALENGGPSGPGRVSYPRTVIAGTDPVAVDAIGVTTASWYGQKFTGSRVKHIVAAARMGLGSLTPQTGTIRKANV